MCYSQATLLYGIWVTTSSLAFAAAAHHDTRAPFAAIDMILERRQLGKLEVTRRGPSVVDVPPEIWEKVKKELLVMEIRQAEISAVNSLRCDDCQADLEHRAFCLGCMVAEASGKLTPLKVWRDWEEPSCDGCWNSMFDVSIDLLGDGKQVSALRTIPPSSRLTQRATRLRSCCKRMV